MGKVVNLFKEKKGDQPGQVLFLRCPCKEGGVTLEVLAMRNSDGPVVVGLVCPECDESYTVEHGKVYRDEEPNNAG